MAHCEVNSDCKKSRISRRIHYLYITSIIISKIWKKKTLSKLIFHGNMRHTKYNKTSNNIKSILLYVRKIKTV